MDQALRCQRCGDVIGTYEPMIVLSDGARHETSLAASPKLAGEGAEHYHSACFAQLHGHSGHPNKEKP
jgi:hypothetical protein